MNKKFIGLGLASVAILSLAACGNRGASKSDSKDAKTDLKAAIVTDTGGVDIATTNLSDDAIKAVKEAKEKIISGDVKVPEK